MPNSAPSSGHLDDLLTLRDWLRYATSAFTKAGLHFGHGTATARDEAAFLLLSTLNLPHDELDPWLDCRLTRSERADVAKIIDRRVQSRLPAPYITQSAWIGPYKFYCDERVIVPRSFIGELLVRDGLAAAVADPDAVLHVLDLCTGSGCLAILAAHAFANAQIDAADLSPGALDVARRNIQDYELTDRITLHRGDLFQALPPQRYDLIISNPPYVTQSAVDAFPPEYKAEPQMAHLGGPDGLDLVRTILETAPQFLSDDGVLVVEIGQGREPLEAAYPQLPFLWLDTEASEGEVFTLLRSELAPPAARSKKAPSQKPARKR